MIRLLFSITFMLSSFLMLGQNTQIALLKYNGGGDWYANLETSLPNLIRFCNQQMNTQIDLEQAIVEPGSPEIFDYPMLHMTGHGNVVFNLEEIENLRSYLLAGGFLHIDDNYGMDQFIRREIKKIFPEEDLVEIPYDHPIYHQQFDFEGGPPKIHEHDGKGSEGHGIVKDGRLVLFYTYEADLGDGWEDQEIHLDSESTRLKAFRMGANIISFVFSEE